MMDRMQDYLIRAGEELGIRVIVPFELLMDSGRLLSADALLPDLGAPKGTIVLRSSDEVSRVAAELEKLGYTYSVFGEPLPGEEYDVDSYKEMFSDWGWAAESERKPRWMT